MNLFLQLLIRFLQLSGAFSDSGFILFQLGVFQQEFIGIDLMIHLFFIRNRVCV